MKLIEVIDLGSPSQFRNLRTLTIPKFLPPLINLVFIVSVILFVFSILLAGIKMILSGGNKEKMDESLRQLLNAIIGIFIVFSTWAIISFIENFFGIKLTTLKFP